MKINYKVLWIEDHFKEVKPFIDGLSIKLANVGFKFEVVKKTTLSDGDIVELRDKLSIYNPYDMIFFDYDLGNMKGNEIASQLRSDIYTDMIFYSGKPNDELRKALFDSQVDGVYIVNRSNFIDNAWPIIEDQIKRICDVNNMRGVILDEMSKIDLKMRSLCLRKYDEITDTERETQLSKFKEKLVERRNQINKQIGSTDISSFSEMIEKPQKVEFNIVRSRLKSITKNDIFAEESELKIKQDLRNEFAHNMAEYDYEKGTVSLVGSDESYGFDEFTEIRKELIEILKSIENIG